MSRVHGVYPGSFNPPTVAHVAIAEAALRHCGLERLDLALSRAPLGKEDVEVPILADRLALLTEIAAPRPGLAVVVTEHRLVADIAAGYDLLVVGADKWSQILDPVWYESPEAHRAALDRLPRVVVAPRAGDPLSPEALGGVELLPLDPAYGAVSSSAARAGQRDLMAPEAAAFDARTGAWSDPARYRRERLPRRAARRLIVDGMNVIGSRPDGWWRDRDGAVRRLVGALQTLAAETGDRVAVVFDGRPLPDLPEGVHHGVLVAYALRAGRDAADDRIAAEVAADRDPSTLVVVTSDAALRRRVESAGASVRGPRHLLPSLPHPNRELA